MDPDVENCAADIKKYFYEFKRSQLRKQYNPHERFRKHAIWVAAAEMCIFLEADPHTFVRSAFLYNNVPGGPFPTQLAGAAIRHWYKNLKDECGATTGQTGEAVIFAEVLTTLKTSLREAMGQIRYSIVEYFVGDHVRVDVTPAFIRLMMFPKNAAMLKRWARAATEELNSNPRLLKIMQEKGYDLSYMEQHHQ